MVELPCWFLHLLPQKIKSCQLLPASRGRGIAEKIDIIAGCVLGPEREYTARGQRLFGKDSVQNFLRVIKQLSRLRADRRVVENRRISSAQFPCVEKWRPIDVIAKFDDRRSDCPGSGEVRFRRTV